MARFCLLLRNELKLFRTGIPIHLVAILQPTVMFVLMAVILVHPTFDMNVAHPDKMTGGEMSDSLVAAMYEVGSPIGEPYINPVSVDWAGGAPDRQVVVVEERGGMPTAVQYFGLIDSNLVKNFRNRLTAAALRLWHAELGQRAVVIEEYAWLPRDVPYPVYFGLAMLPLTVFFAASILGGVLTAQEFEFGTIEEYRLAPAPIALILGARLVRLVLVGLLSAAILMVTAGFVNGAWPEPLWPVGLILLPVAVTAGCLGIGAGLAIRKTIPAFIVGLVASFVGWILGSAFGLAAGFSGWYERISRLTPFTHAVELLFPLYYGAEIGNPLRSTLFLVLLSTGMLALVALAYRQRVLRQE
jgi:ABC-type multidrug transport system permease subunit